MTLFSSRGDACVAERMGLGQPHVQSVMVPSLHIPVGARPHVSQRGTQGGQRAGEKRNAEPRGDAYAAFTATTAQHGACALPQGQEQVYGMPQTCPSELPKALPKRGVTPRARAVAALAHLCLSQQTAPSGR